MSMTKDSMAYHMHMEELFEQNHLDERDHSDQEYLEWCYLQERERAKQQEWKDPLHSFGDFISRLVDPKQDKPPADDVQPGEKDE